MQVAELADSHTAKDMIAILMKMGSVHEKDRLEAKAELLNRKDVKLQTSPSMVPRSHVASLPFYSQVPHRFGDYVGKHALIPATSQQNELLDDLVKDSDPPSIMATKLKDYYANHEAVYLWQFQLLENTEEQPVEYAGKTSPFPNIV